MPYLCPLLLPSRKQNLHAFCQAVSKKLWCGSTLDILQLRLSLFKPHQGQRSEFTCLYILKFLFQLCDFCQPIGLSYGSLRQILVLSRKLNSCSRKLSLLFSQLSHSGLEFVSHLIILDGPNPLKKKEKKKSCVNRSQKWSELLMAGQVYIP